jgi:hypothetical protein
LAAERDLYPVHGEQLSQQHGRSNEPRTERKESTPDTPEREAFS